MLRIRSHIPTAFGALPSPDTCTDVVGRIQQTLNAAAAAGRISNTSVPMPLPVSGKADQSTEAVLDSALPGWEIQLPDAVLRQLQTRYGVPAAVAFSCTTSTFPWGVVAVAGLGILAAVFVLGGRPTAAAPVEATT